MVGEFKKSKLFGESHMWEIHNGIIQYDNGTFTNSIRNGTIQHYVSYGSWKVHPDDVGNETRYVYCYSQHQTQTYTDGKRGVLSTLLSDVKLELLPIVLSAAGITDKILRLTAYRNDILAVDSIVIDIDSYEDNPTWVEPTGRPTYDKQDWLLF